MMKLREPDREGPLIGPDSEVDEEHRLDAGSELEGEVIDGVAKAEVAVVGSSRGCVPRLTVWPVLTVVLRLEISSLTVNWSLLETSVIWMAGKTWPPTAPKLDKPPRRSIWLKTKLVGRPGPPGPGGEVTALQGWG